MSKQLRFNYEGREYTLEYTRKTVEMMERQGFAADEVFTKPMSTLPALFAGAFLANHRFTKPEVIDAIYAKMPNRGELISKLVDMYNEPIVTLMAEPEESEGNLTWTTSW